MQEITIPVWALTVFGAILLPWLLWLTNKVNDNGTKIAINTANDSHVENELKKIYIAIETSNDNMKERFNQLDLRLNQFMSTEMNLLKQIVNK